jgi:phosphoglycerate dehydrogenase-like enzyme
MRMRWQRSRRGALRYRPLKPMPDGRVRLGILGQLPPEYAQQLGDVEIVSGDAAYLNGLIAWELDVPGILAGLERQPDLPWVHLRWAGVPRAVVEAVRGTSTVLTNGSGAHGTAIAEYVLGVLLWHYKRFGDMRRAQTEATWLKNMQLRELRGSLVGVVGLGDLGRSTARALRGLGLRLRGLSRTGAPCADVDEVFAASALASFVDGLDVLVVAAPLTPATMGLIGAEELARLAPGGLLVNVGRAALVDQAAMLEALENGTLGGAALDVFEAEPLPAESPLWRLPNVFISPHCSDATPESRERGFLILRDNVGRLCRGEPLRNLVDLDQGY